MEDIYDIYEPIYKNTNYIPLIIISTVIVLIIIALVFIFLKKRKSKKIITIDTMYEKSLSNIVFLKGEVSKLSSKDFLIKSNRILFNFLGFIYNKNYFALTSGELLNKITEYNFPKKDFLHNQFLNITDKTLYGKNEIPREDRILLLKNYGEIIDSIYKERTVD